MLLEYSGSQEPLFSHLKESLYIKNEFGLKDSQMARTKHENLAIEIVALQRHILWLIVRKLDSTITQSLAEEDLPIDDAGVDWYYVPTTDKSIGRIIRFKQELGNLFKDQPKLHEALLKEIVSCEKVEELLVGLSDKQISEYTVKVEQLRLELYEFN